MKEIKIQSYIIVLNKKFTMQINYIFLVSYVKLLKYSLTLYNLK